MIIPVILSGGAGTRLWPISRELEPKHLVELLGTTTLLQKTVARLEGLKDTAAPVVVGNHAHHQLVIDQLAEVGVQPAAMLLEPIGRNTAPAAAVAAIAASPGRYRSNPAGTAGRPYDRRPRAIPRGNRSR